MLRGSGGEDLQRVEAARKSHVFGSAEDLQALPRVGTAEAIRSAGEVLVVGGADHVMRAAFPSSFLPFFLSLLAGIFSFCCARRCSEATWELFYML